MVSPRTKSRQTKVKLLKQTLDNTLELLLLQHKDRDFIHLAQFRKMYTKSKVLLEQAKPITK